jgi:hypothetical protein
MAFIKARLNIPFMLSLGAIVLLPKYQCFGDAQLSRVSYSERRSLCALEDSAFSLNSCWCRGSQTCMRWGTRIVKYAPWCKVLAVQTWFKLGMWAIASHGNTSPVPGIQLKTYYPLWRNTDIVSIFWPPMPSNSGNLFSHTYHTSKVFRTGIRCQSILSYREILARWIHRDIKSLTCQTGFWYLVHRTPILYHAAEDCRISRTRRTRSRGVYRPRSVFQIEDKSFGD